MGSSSSLFGIPNARAKSGVVSLDLSSADWEVVNDSVMGGVSSSTVTTDDGYVTFSGYATTDSNGGFANSRAYFDAPLDWSECSGVSFNMKGDGQKYVMDFMTTYSRWAPSYEVAVVPTTSWQRVDVRWSEFEPTAYWRSPKSAVDPLRTDSLYSLGIKRTAFARGLKKDPTFRSGNFRVMLSDMTCIP